MARLSFEGHAKGSIEHVVVGIRELVLAPDYRSASVERLTQDERIGVKDGPMAARVVLLGAADRLWVTAGADLGERTVVARTAWRFEEVEPHWGRLMLGNEPLANMRAPREVIVAWKGSKRLPVGVALFCGPQPAAGTTIELTDPVLGRTIKHSY